MAALTDCDVCRYPNMGLKKDYHAASLRLAVPVLEKIRGLAPDALVTDCLSCRRQFVHALPYSVYHSMEMPMSSCGGDDLLVASD